MKKTITILILLICSLSLFAETGYRGFEWGTSEFLFNLKAGEQDDPIDIGDEKWPIIPKVYKTKLLGDERNLYYYFADGNLMSALYFIPSELTDKLISNLEEKKLIAQRQLPEDTGIKIEENIKKTNPKEGEAGAKFRDFLLGVSFIYLCYSIDGSDYSKLEKQEANTLLYIYNYNSDTRLYIYKNVIKDTTIVVYYPHEQDY